MSSWFPQRFSIEQTPTNEIQLLSIDDAAADEVFSTLSSTTTRAILSSLCEAPQTASDVSKEVGTSLQNATYHLEKLQGANLIEVVDTWYSDSGREMKVYAPTNESLVLFATESENEKTLRESVLRLIGSIAVLALMGILIDYLYQVFRDPQSQNVQLGHTPGVTSPAIGSTNAIIHLSPGELFFITGFVAVLIVSIWMYFLQGHGIKRVLQNQSK